MKKMALYLIAVFLIFVLAAAFVFGADRTQEENRNFLKDYGWQVEEQAVEIEEISLPAQFDEVYRRYNELQYQAGLDLLPYCGKTCTRYTYLVKNYPKPVEDEVRANVICYRGKPIAGDIMTVRLDGFMHSLIFPKTE